MSRGKLAAIIGGSLIVAILVSRSIFNVGPGEEAAVFDPLSNGIQQTTYGEGLHAKPAWATVYHYNIKNQGFTATFTGTEAEQQIRTVTKEGLYIGADITINFRLQHDAAAWMLGNFGRDGVYQETIVYPAIRSVIREIVSQHSATEVYGSGRTIVESEIGDALVERLTPSRILIQQVLLRDVSLPQQITTSIEAKQAAEQDALRMQYVLQKEQLEAERKVIEAGGIADANIEIAGSLTEQYLTWYWIEQMKNNPNVVYMVPSEGGLPLFKNIDELPQGGTAPVTPVVPPALTP